MDLRSIEEITPAGALLLAAELDRWTKIHKTKLRARDTDQWNPGVLSLLNQMGFFKLLSRPSSEGALELTAGDIEFLPFYSGEDSNGRPFLELRDGLEALVGKLPFRPRLFQAVSEAIINVRHHAYAVPKGHHSPNALRSWWLSASVDKPKGEVTVMVLDHGVGIPSTLPRKGVGENLRKYLGVASLRGYSDDAKMIEAAITLGRSGTGEAHRGHGLARDIVSFLERHKKYCRLRIFSNKGCVEVTKTEGSAPVFSLRNNNVSLKGTFLEWKFAI